MARRLETLTNEQRRKLSLAMRESWRQRGHVTDETYIVVRLSDAEAKHVAEILEVHTSLTGVANRLRKAKRYPPKRYA